MAGYDCATIADMAGISSRAVLRKLANIEPLEYITNGGRPRKIYDASVLKLFPQIQCLVKVDESNEISKSIENSKVVTMQARRIDLGANRNISKELNEKLTLLCKQIYLRQGDKRGLKRSVATAVETLWKEISAETNEENSDRFARNFYNKHINRSDAIFKGIAKREKWVNLWESRHKVNANNAKTVTARYDMLELLQNAGWIGQGFGAGKLWVMDATQLDVWTKDRSGKLETFNYLLIMCGVTKFPLYIKELKKGEKIEEVAVALQECARLHGVPEMGIVADNGAAFRSKKIQALVKSWYSAGALEAMKNDAFRKEIFHGQTGAIIYPLAGIPRYPFKAAIERSFDSLNIHQMERFPVSYIGTRDSRYLTHELGSTPKIALREAPTKEDAFSDFLSWIYSVYINRGQFGSKYLSYMKRVGKKPTPLEAWLYFGGQFKQNGEFLNIEPQKKVEISDAAEPFFALSISKEHIISPGLGSAVLQEKNESIQYHSEIFSYQRIGEKLTLVPFDNNSKAYVFAVADVRQPRNEKIIVDAASAIEFLGIAESAVIKTVEDLSQKRAKIRKTAYAVRKEQNDAVRETLGTLNYKNTAELQKAEYAQELSDAEVEIIDSCTPALTQGAEVSPPEPPAPNVSEWRREITPENVNKKDDYFNNLLNEIERALE